MLSKKSVRHLLLKVKIFAPSFNIQEGFLPKSKVLNIKNFHNKRTFDNLHQKGRLNQNNTSILRFPHTSCFKSVAFSM